VSAAVPPCLARGLMEGGSCAATGAPPASHEGLRRAASAAERESQLSSERASRPAVERERAGRRAREGQPSSERASRRAREGQPPSERASRPAVERERASRRAGESQPSRKRASRRARERASERASRRARERASRRARERASRWESQPGERARRGIVGARRHARAAGMLACGSHAALRRRASDGREPHGSRPSEKAQGRENDGRLFLLWQLRHTCAQVWCNRWSACCTCAPGRGRPTPLAASPRRATTQRMQRAVPSPGLPLRPGSHAHQAIPAITVSPAWVPRWGGVLSRLHTHALSRAHTSWHSRAQPRAHTSPLRSAPAPLR
jgi:hypothetical protein